MTLVYLVFSIVVSLIVYTNYKEHRRINLFLLTNIVILLIYGIVPIFLLSNNFYIGKTDSLLIYTLKGAKVSYLFSFLMIFLGYTSFLLSYKISNSMKVVQSLKYIHVKITKQKILIIGLITLVVSLTSTLIVSKNLGGIIESLNFVEDIRSGENLNVGVYYIILPISIVSFLAFLSLAFTVKKGKIIYIFLLFVTLILSIYYLLIFGGRLPLFLFLLIIPMYFMTISDSIKIRYLVFTMFAGLIILSYADSIFKLLSGKDVFFPSINQLFTGIIIQFSFPYINTLKVPLFQESLSDYRYFLDYFSWIINYFPVDWLESIGIDEITPLYVINTYNHYAQFLDHPLFGGIPNDIFSFGYYQMGLFGVIINSSIFAIIIAFLDAFFYKKHDVFISFVWVRIVQIFMFIPMYGDVEVFFKRRLDVVLLLLIMLAFKKYRIRNTKLKEVNT